MSESRLADRAYTGIVEIINRDRLEVGDRLPSEAALAEMFGISRTIVREALVRLASDGITDQRIVGGPRSIVHVARPDIVSIGERLKRLDECGIGHVTVLPYASGFRASR